MRKARTPSHGVRRDERDTRILPGTRGPACHAGIATRRVELNGNARHELSPRARRLGERRAHLVASNLTPRARSERAELQSSELHPSEGRHLVADRLEQPAHLTVPSFRQHHDRVALAR